MVRLVAEWLLLVYRSAEDPNLSLLHFLANVMKTKATELLCWFEELEVRLYLVRRYLMVCCRALVELLQRLMWRSLNHSICPL